MTNADRIRQMTDEELAEWLCALEKPAGFWPEAIPLDVGEYGAFTDSYDGWLLYLEQEVKR